MTLGVRGSRFPTLLFVALRECHCVDGHFMLCPRHFRQVYVGIYRTYVRT